MEKAPINKDKTSPSEPAVKGLYARYRVAAMGKVAHEMGIPFTKIAKPGQKYGDKLVLKKQAYVSVDSGERTAEFWEKVDASAPPPIFDDIKSGKYWR